VFLASMTAEKQYAALLKYIQDPNGLSKRLERDRQSELTADRHGLPTRVGLKLAHVVTLGVFTHREESEPTTLTAELDRHRRAQRQSCSWKPWPIQGPQVEVVWNLEQVRHAVEDLESTGLQAKDSQLLQRILQQTKDPVTRLSWQRPWETP